MNKKCEASDLDSCIMVKCPVKKRKEGWLAVQTHVINAQIEALIVQRDVCVKKKKGND